MSDLKPRGNDQSLLFQLSAPKYETEQHTKYTRLGRIP